MKNILFIFIFLIMLINTDCQNTVQNQPSESKKSSIVLNTALEQNEIELLVYQIEQSISNKQIQQYFHPNMTYCGGVRGFYKNDELKCVKTKHSGELGFSAIDAYFYKNEIIQLVKHDHHAIWEKYDEAVIDGEFVKEKMPYTDTLTTSILGRSFQTLKVWETDSSIIQAKEDFLSQQLICIEYAIEALSEEKVIK